MLAEVHVVATKSDTEDCHRLGKNGNTIVLFVNRKLCHDNSWKKMTFTRILTSLNLVLVWIYAGKNLTLRDQCLTWKCQEMKRVKKYGV